MTARLISRAGIALMVVVAAALGFITGFETAPRYDTRLIHCSIEHSPGYTPCPPPIGVEVWAVWEGGIRTLATWEGKEWRFSEPVLGLSRTIQHPLAWEEP